MQPLLLSAQALLPVATAAAGLMMGRSVHGGLQLLAGKLLPRPTRYDDRRPVGGGCCSCRGQRIGDRTARCESDYKSGQYTLRITLDDSTTGLGREGTRAECECYKVLLRLLSITRASQL